MGQTAIDPNNLPYADGDFYAFEEVLSAPERARLHEVRDWLAKEIRATIPNHQRVHAGPHVCGGMTMPPEIIVSEIKTALGMKTFSLAGRGS